jgi:hypothetical protein
MGGVYDGSTRSPEGSTCTLAPLDFDETNTAFVLDPDGHNIEAVFHG